MDDTFIAVAPAQVAVHFADPAVWRSWWPDLDLTVREDRATEGIRWDVSGRLKGSAEVWIEPYGTKGCFVHFYLRTAPAHPRRFRRKASARRLVRRYTIAWKQRIHELKDTLER